MTRGSKRSTNLCTPLPNSLTSNKFWLQTGMVLERPTRVCNASMPVARSEDLPALQTPSARPGADQFRQYRSRGWGC